MGLIDWPGENCKGEREANFIADEQIFATSNFIFRSPLSPSVLSFKNDLCQRQTRAASRRNETSDRAVPCIFLAPQPGKRTSLGFQSRFEKKNLCNVTDRKKSKVRRKNGLDQRRVPSDMRH